MEQLIKVKKNNDGSQVVSARELHEFLEVSTQFRTWMPRMIDYGFEEGIDFERVIKNVRGQVASEYAITLDMAKELSMIQRSEKGKQARKYFIECEKKLFRPSYQIEDKIERAIAWAEEQKQVMIQLAEAEDAINFKDQITNSNRLSNVSEVAGIMNTGRNKLYQWLRDKKYVQKQINKPYQKYIDSGHFDFKIDSVNKKQYYTILITGKGIALIKSKWKQ